MLVPQVMKLSINKPQSLFKARLTQITHLIPCGLSTYDATWFCHTVDSLYSNHRWDVAKWPD